MPENFHIDQQDWERQKKWREVKDKWVPLILGWRIAGHSREEIKEHFYRMLQEGKLTMAEYLILEPEADDSKGINTGAPESGRG